MARAGARWAPTVKAELRGFSELSDTPRSSENCETAWNNEGHHPFRMMAEAVSDLKTAITRLRGTP
jgi:hypothetical protein